MRSVLRYIKDFFGYTRRERRSSFLLLLLVGISLLIRAFIPEFSINVEETTLSYSVEKNSLLFIESHVTDTLDFAEQQLTLRQEHIVSEQYQQIKDPDYHKIIPELNSCDSMALEALPGLGPVLSARIIKFRELLGGFYSVEQLKEVYGLPAETFSLVRDMVIVDTTGIRLIDVNDADYVSLIRLPYFSKEDVNNILRYRSISGRINSMEELVVNGVLGENTAKIVSHYLSFYRLSEESD